MFKMSNGNPSAAARIKGSGDYPDIRGKVELYDTYGGTVLVVEIYGLPETLEEENGGFYGFHIHEGAGCTGDKEDHFKDAGMHFNPQNREHPRHAGDLPPLLASRGVAWAAVYTGRFYPEDVIGKTIIVHSKPDDFRTQPSGDSGEKIACGEIVSLAGEIEEGN